MQNADPDEPRQPPRQPAGDNPWRVASRFNVAGVERSPDPARGPHFASDSSTALVVLASVVGPTSVLVLRTLAVVARAGPTTWPVDDLAAMHGVNGNYLRHTLDRLVRFDWLNVNDPQRVRVYLSGSLSRNQLHRLPRVVAEQHLLGHSPSLDLEPAESILDQWATAGSPHPSTPPSIDLPR